MAESEYLCITNKFYLKRGDALCYSLWEEEFTEDDYYSKESARFQMQSSELLRSVLEHALKEMI